MSGYLLDTNVLSELARQKPDPRVASFLSGLSDAYISVLTIHELHYGLELLPPKSKKHVALSAKVDAFATAFADRIIPVSYGISKLAAPMRVNARQAGRTVHIIDVLIAATAYDRGLIIATRNTKDFEGLGVQVFNPWE